MSCWLICIQVWWVFGVDTVMTILFTIAAWDGMAAGWGDLNTLTTLDWPFNALPCLSGMGKHMSYRSFLVLTPSSLDDCPHFLLLENLETCQANQRPNRYHGCESPVAPDVSWQLNASADLANIVGHGELLWHNCEL